MNDKEYLDLKIKSLERLIALKMAQGYNAEDLAEEIHDLAVFKNQY